AALAHGIAERGANAIGGKARRADDRVRHFHRVERRGVAILDILRHGRGARRARAALAPQAGHAAWIVAARTHPATGRDIAGRHHVVVAAHHRHVVRADHYARTGLACKAG